MSEFVKMTINGKAHDVKDETARSEINEMKYVEVKVPSSGWSSSAPYTQSVNVESMTSSWVPGNPVLVSSGNTTTDLAALEAFSYVSTITSSNAYLTFTCFEDLPTADFTIRIPGLVAAE